MTVPEDATGNVTVTVDGKNYSAEVINGTVTVKPDNLTPGVHDIKVSYSGDENNTGVTFNSTVTVPMGFTNGC